MAMKTGDDRLTRTNIGQYESDIRSAVQEYRMTNSYTNPETGLPSL